MVSLDLIHSNILKVFFVNKFVLRSLTAKLFPGKYYYNTFESQISIYSVLKYIFNAILL